jgi:2-dehydro-3-deoxyphosphogalactonate aldolase
VGGVGAETIPAWKAAGAAGFGVGSSLYRPGDAPAVVAGRAKALRAALGFA